MENDNLLESVVLVEGTLIDLDILVEKANKVRAKKDLNWDTIDDEDEDVLHRKLYATLHSHILDIWFTKKNKRYRRIRCTLNPEQIPPDQHGKGIVDRSKKYWFMNVYDLKKKDWRTIRLDYIDKIRHVKRVETPSYGTDIFEKFEMVDFYGNKL